MSKKASKKAPKRTPRTRKAAAPDLPPGVGAGYVEIKPGELIPNGAEFQSLDGLRWLPSCCDKGQINPGSGLIYRRKSTPAPQAPEYRPLGDNDIITSEDEFLSVSGQWFRFGKSVGNTVSSAKEHLDKPNLYVRRKVTPVLVRAPVAAPEPARSRIVTSATASLTRGRGIVVERLENTLTNITITNTDGKVIAFGLSPDAAHGLLCALNLTAPSHV